MATKLEQRIRDKTKAEIPLSDHTIADVQPHPLLHLSNLVISLRQRKEELSVTMAKLEAEYEQLCIMYDQTSNELSATAQELQRQAM